MKTYVIMNPNASRVTDEAARDVGAALERLGKSTLSVTDQPGEARGAAREAVQRGFDLVVAVGGDGTINEVVNGLAPDFGKARLGIIPLGTGNDFARSLDIPTDPAGAIDVILAGRTQRADVVKISNSEERYYINMSAAGFSGQVDENLTPEMKEAWGTWAYLRSGLGALPELTPYRTQIRFDEDGLYEVEAYNIVIANARYVGGGIPIAPAAKLNDGLVDVMIVPVVATPWLVLAMTEIMLGQHLDSKILLHRRARSLHLRAEPEMWINVDGELITREPTRFEVLHRVLSVITGPEPEAF